MVCVSLSLSLTHTQVGRERDRDRETDRHRECPNGVTVRDNHIINKSCTRKRTSNSLKIRLGKVYLSVKSMSTRLPRINHILKNC